MLGAEAENEPIFDSASLLSLPPETRAQAAIVLDAATSTVLYEKNADTLIPPASLTKLMTTHIALSEGAKLGIGPETLMRLPPDSWARNQPPRSSLMWLDEGHHVTLRELLLGLAIPSGNDAAVAVALNISPTVEHFAVKMTEEAKNLGLKNTVFVEPSGISEENWTTARDFAEFCRFYIKRYPQNLTEYHSVPQFAYPKADNVPRTRRHNPRTITQSNHISLLRTYRGVDGLKTGYIDESGYNLALTAEQDGTRFIAVLLGVPAGLGAYWGPRYRDADGAAFLDWAFSNYRTLRMEYPEIKEARVWKGTKNYIKTYAEKDALTISRWRGDSVSIVQNQFSGLTAPLESGARVGELIISDEEGELGRSYILAEEDIERGNIFKRIWDAIVMFFSGVKSIEA